MLGEEPGCLDQEAGAGLGGLVGEDLAEGDPGAVIDGRVDRVVAQAPAAPGRGRGGRPLGDPAELLDVDADQFPGLFALIAHDHAARPVGVASRLM
jgi:hypothetical protein